MVRGCLMMLGVVGLLIVGSCVMTGVSIWRLANPTHFSQTVDETPERARRLLGSYLEVAENEGQADRGLGKIGDSKLAIQEFSDGSVRLTLDGDKARLLEIVASFRPRKDETTAVEIYSDARELAQRLRPRVQASALHRQIRTQLKEVLSNIDRHKVVGGGFLISRMIADAREGGETVRRIP